MQYLARVDPRHQLVVAAVIGGLVGRHIGVAAFGSAMSRLLPGVLIAVLAVVALAERRPQTGRR